MCMRESPDANYSPQKKVAEHITPESLASRNGNRDHSTFQEDAQVPEMFRGKLKDYYRSGYDRGHQVYYFISPFPSHM